MKNFSEKKSQAVETHLPCPDTVGCGSSDAYSRYDDGHGYCFACAETFKDGEVTSQVDEKVDPKDFEGFTYEFLPWRGITRETMQFYNVGTKIDEGGKPHSIAFVYPNGGIKVRGIDDKKFIAKGPMSEARLFGTDKFPPASAKGIIITEGELDAMSAYQMLGGTFPCVSIRASGSARKDISGEFDYINSFERIYLCTDNDEVGKKAAQEIAGLFDFNKVFQVPMGGFKDANEYLAKGFDKEFRTGFNSARRYLPEGIVSSLTDFGAILDADGDRPSIPHPFNGLQDKTLGIRTGEFILVTAPEGIGKTEFIRRYEHYLLKHTSVPIGAIHLEETKARQLKGLAGIELEAPVHLPEASVSNVEIKAALEKITDGRDDRLHIYSHFGSDDPDVLLDAIRFMVAVCGCKYVFLDHITMVVTGLETEDERRTLDYLSTKLATMCHDLDFTLFCISHVNDDGKTRGSRNIGKVANLRIDLNRNLLAELEEDRNKTYVTVSKNRYAGKTGPAGVLGFDPDAFMLRELPDMPAITIPKE